MIFLILLFVVIIILASNVRIVPQASAYVIDVYKRQVQQQLLYLHRQ